MKKILFIIERTSISRGMTTGLENLAISLNSKYEVHIITKGNNYEIKFLNNMHYHFIDNFDKSRKLRYEVTSLIKKHNITVIIAWYYYLLIVWSKYNSSKTVFISNQGHVIYNKLVVDLFKMYFRKKVNINKMVTIFTRHILVKHKIHHHVSISKTVQNSHERMLNIPKNKSSVIYRGIDTSFYKPLDSYQMKMDKKQINILYVGNINPSKGIDILIDSVMTLRFPINLKLCGNVKKDYLLAIQKKLNSSKENVKLEYLGVLKPINIVMQNSMSDIVVYPSLSEGLGKACLESMSCERPVICSNISAFKEIVSHNINGKLFDLGSSHSLANEISSFINDNYLSKKCALNGRKTVVDSFNVEEECNKWIDLIKKTVIMG